MAVVVSHHDVVIPVILAVLVIVEPTASLPVQTMVALLRVNPTIPGAY
jgi:hypothetical protein